MIGTPTNELFADLEDVSREPERAIRFGVLR